MLKLNFSAVESAIREVAQTEILPRFRNLHQGDVDFKIGDDPVTVADKEAEKALSKRLIALLPGSKVVGEESYFENPALSDLFFSDSYVWIIDPIDGTRNFVAGKEQFGVIVALTKQNETIAAWHYNPLKDEFIVGEKGSGVFYKGRKLKILPPAPLAEMRGNLGMYVENTLAARKKRGEASPQDPIVSPCYWSICYEYAQLFLEKPDFSLPEPQWHFHGLYNYCSPWDNAAGVFMHQECGGFGAHWDGRPFKPSDYVRGTEDYDFPPAGPYADGLLLAPDPESWQTLHNWLSPICALPKATLSSPEEPLSHLTPSK